MKPAVSPTVVLALLIGIVVGIGLEHLAAVASVGASLHVAAWGQPPAALTTAVVSIGTAGAVTAEAWGSLPFGTQEALLGLAGLIAATILGAVLGRAHRAATPAPAGSEPDAGGILFILVAVLLVLVVATWAEATLILEERSWLIAGALWMTIYASCVYRESRRAETCPNLEPRPHPVPVDAQPGWASTP